MKKIALGLLRLPYVLIMIAYYETHTFFILNYVKVYRFWSEKILRPYYRNLTAYYNWKAANIDRETAFIRSVRNQNQR